VCSYLALRKSGRMCPCKSVKVIENLRAVLSSSSSEKSVFFNIILYYTGNFFSLYHTVVEIFLCLWTTSQFHQ